VSKPQWSLFKAFTLIDRFAAIHANAVQKWHSFRRALADAIPPAADRPGFPAFY